jgi:hypothetical protein
MDNGERQALEQVKQALREATDELLRTLAELRQPELSKTVVTLAQNSGPQPK